MFHVTDLMLRNAYAGKEGLADQASDCPVITCCCIRNMIHNPRARDEVLKPLDIGQNL